MAYFIETITTMDFGLTIFITIYDFPMSVAIKYLVRLSLVLYKKWRLSADCCAQYLSVNSALFSGTFINKAHVQYSCYSTRKSTCAQFLIILLQKLMFSFPVI